ncbi:ENTH domain, partial [Dillenia turbinata]
MKKAFDQTVRDIKREVNKKVLKVPGIEQKVLDATSNEPWGPHGSHLADIAQATRNYHEYQMIMAVIWKRVNDTGKNWRHVYKALTVLEYLVAHGSERVIDEIREHAYQISTLSDFQYIDSSGRDQGSNVRRKSQSLVALVNDKERIQEVRQKAAANRDKFRSASSAGGMYRPGGYGDRYDDDRYGGKDEDRYGYGREGGYRDDDRYSRNGDHYGRDRDRYSDDRYGRESYRDDDYGGRRRSIDDTQYGPRSRSVDRDRDRSSFEDEDRYSSRRLDRKFSEQNLGAAPSYEEAVSDARSPAKDERIEENATASAPKASSPPVSANPGQPTTAPVNSASPVNSGSPTNQEADGFDEFDPRAAVPAAAPATANSEVDLLGSLSESFSANALALMPVTSTTATSEADTANSDLGPSFTASASTANNQPFDDPFGDTPFKALLSTEDITAKAQNPSAVTFQSGNQPFEPQQEAASGLETASSFNYSNAFPGITYNGPTSSATQVTSTNPQFLPQDLSTQDQETDILADILPPPGPSTSMTPHQGFLTSQPSFLTASGQPAQASASVPGASPFMATQPGFLAAGSQPTQHGTNAPGPSSFIAPQPNFPASGGQPTQPSANIPGPSPFMASNSTFPVQGGQPIQPSANVPGPSPFMASHPTFLAQGAQPNQPSPNVPGPSPFMASPQSFVAQGGQPTQPNTNVSGSFLQQSPMPSHMALQTPSGTVGHNHVGGFLPHSGPAGPVPSQIPHHTSITPAPQHNMNSTGNFLTQTAPSPPVSQLNSLATAASPSMASQPPKDKFETKSMVWADTLSRGLVNLNISGPKINPLADIGIDFESINRKEKRMEKPTTTTVTSTITMGKAMGTGSGIGRAGASALRAPPNPMMGAGLNMRGIPGVGVNMAGYGVMNQQMGGGMPMNPNVGMNMQMAMQTPAGLPPGGNMPMGYNPMMHGGYNPHQQYG